MSTGFSIFVILGTLLSILAFFLLLHLNRKANNPGQTTGHSSDGIEELDNPLPVWWYWWFVLTILFSLAYLVYYPGLGNFKGVGGWSQVSQLEQKQQVADEKFGPIYAQYRDYTLDELVETPEAMRMGRRIFASNCTLCHGADGEGSFGFPNLTDEEWLWGGDDADIFHTIALGRKAIMTPWGPTLGTEGVRAVTEYVLQLAGRDDVDAELAASGAAHYSNFCVACHGADGKGQKVFGAPDLTNEIWLYGDTRLRIEQVIKHGRNGVMPAFKDRLGEDRVHLLAGYIKSLSDNP